MNSVHDLLVASWTLDLFAASEWLTMVLKLKETRGGCAAVGGLVIGLICTQMLLVFEPLRVIHHSRHAENGEEWLAGWKIVVSFGVRSK